MLPQEILLTVLRETRAPRFQHDPSAYRCADNTWLAELRVRKGLTLVCKAWSGPATELLYEDIVIRRMGQLPALAHVLDQEAVGRRDLARLVKSIRIDSCVVVPQCLNAVEHALQSILARCKALRTVEVRPHRAFPVISRKLDHDAPEVFNPAWFLAGYASDLAKVFQERCATLRTLDIAMGLSAEQVMRLHQCLSTASNLESLKLGSVSIINGAKDLNSLHQLELPSLRELFIFVDDDQFCAHVTAKWTLPILRRLTMVNMAAVPYQLLACHGSRLTFLNMCPPVISGIPLDPPRWQTVDLRNLGCLATMCPTLDHLVLPAPYPYVEDGLLRSDTLRFIDLWTSLTDS
ncbi:hypothetical protein BD413DRAFT_466116, partial [Trametes elegans]